MTYKKRSSPGLLARLRERMTGFKSIDPAIDLGNDISAKVFTQKVNNLQQMLDAYNTLLADADALKNRLVTTEKDLSEYSERVLLAVAAKYGKDSDEYERAGGVRRSDRKRPTRQLQLTIQPTG